MHFPNNIVAGFSEKVGARVYLSLTMPYNVHVPEDAMVIVWQGYLEPYGSPGQSMGRECPNRV